MRYFGTNLTNCGHYFWRVSEGGHNLIAEPSSNTFKSIPFNPEGLTMGLKRKGESIFLNIEDYSILAIEGSPYDVRGGSKSVFFIDEILTEEEMRERVESIPICKKIIEGILKR
jgi:hypothetical protein